jgi:hypothetical protein
LVRANFEVNDNGVSSRVMVLAESLRHAEEVLRTRYPEGEVRIIFPLDGECFLASHGRDQQIEVQDLV